MEVPAHDKWEYGRCRDNPNYYKQAYEELRKKIRNIVKEEFTKLTDDEIDAYGAGDFLPELEERKKINGKKGEDLDGKIAKLEVRDIKPPEHLTSAKIPNADTIEVSVPVHKKHAHTGAVNPNLVPPTSRVKEKFVAVPIVKRVIAKPGRNGYYRAVLVPENDAKYSFLAIEIAGEVSSFKTKVLSARLVSGNAEILKTVGNKISLRNIKKTGPIIIDFCIDFTEYCMMEMKYYESKK